MLNKRLSRVVPVVPHNNDDIIHDNNVNKELKTSLVKVIRKRDNIDSFFKILNSLLKKYSFPSFLNEYYKQHNIQTGDQINHEYGCMLGEYKDHIFKLHGVQLFGVSKAENTDTLEEQNPRNKLKRESSVVNELVGKENNDARSYMDMKRMLYVR